MPQFAQTPAEGLTPAQLNARAKAQNVPEIPFESAPNFLKLPPNLYLGEGIGVATNSKGHIFVYTRSQATRLFEFDAKGNYLREIGEGLYGFAFAHAVRVDPQDNIWAVDEGTNMVIKFNPEGRVADGAGPKAGAVEGAPRRTAPEPYRFDRPTDVAWDAAGNIFVSDGYGNSRVVKYDKNGRFIAAVGSKGSAPGQLNLPHTIAADAKGNVYVGDRSNSRIQVFDNDLNFKAIYDQVGAPWAVCISPGPHQYLYSSNSNPDSNNSLICRGHRRDLQDGAGRHHPRQVRTRRQEAGRVQHRARNRLPQRERTAGERNHRLARAEAHRCIRQGGRNERPDTKLAALRTLRCWPASLHARDRLRFACRTC